MQGEYSANVAPVPFALGVVPWRQNGVLRVTVVVKASFLAKSSPMVPATAPQPYRISDAHYKNQPIARVVSSADRVPRKLRVDVTVLGHAHAKRGQSVEEMNVRVALMQGDSLAFDKRLRVIGARIAESTPPIPFVRMPIVYERALGGIGTAENPIGCGEEGDDDDRPNVLDPQNPSRPIGLGPIGAAWPIRKKRLGQTPVRDVESPLMILPNEFDFGYFQSAPEDQQIDELAPGATLILEGFDPEREKIEIALPSARAMGAIYGLDSADPDMATPIEFRADALHLDADQWIATLTFRGHVEIRDESRLDQIVVATGIGIGGLDPVIPSLRPPPDRIKPAAEVSPAATNENVGGTLMIGNESAGVGPAMPFASGSQVLPAQRKKRSSETLVLPLAAWAKGPTKHLSTATLAFAAIPADMVPALPEPPVAPAISAATPAVMPGPLPISPPPMMPVVAHVEPEVRLGEPTGSVAQVDEPPGSPHEIVDIDRYGFVSALLEERGAKLAHVLEKQVIDIGIWRKAERHWRQELRREMAEGIQNQVARFEEAFVRGWESLHPGRFGVEHYARLTIAEKEARIVRELRNQGVEPSLGMRLRRVWRRRILQDDALKRAFDEVVEQRAGA
ncbi:MAG TPA: DUF2169 domain-containing protein [Polyangium sp.]|nr:DUF2169 domain-containing protein [Polyangium sp.]